MTAEPLLARLDAVISTGQNTWRARCPAHGSKGRTLAIKEAEDGRVLLRCHAECSALEVVQSVGLSMGDLFPEPLPDMPRRREKFPAGDVLRCLTHEALVVYIAASSLADGNRLTDADRARLGDAARRMRAATEVAR